MVWQKTALCEDGHVIGSLSISKEKHVSPPSKRNLQMFLGCGFCGFLGVSLALVFAFGVEAKSPAAPDQNLRVVIFGAHPDDPESGCGGLIALLTKSGHEVIVAYAT